MLSTIADALIYAWYEADKGERTLMGFAAVVILSVSLFGLIQSPIFVLSSMIVVAILGTTICGIMVFLAKLMLWRRRR